jgi:hypothetical protein
MDLNIDIHLSLLPPDHFFESNAGWRGFGDCFTLW